MRDPRINFRSREIALVLAFLIPGAGHFYQRRNLKAGIFFTGILGLFFTGMLLGDWQPVYSQVVHSPRANTGAQMLPAEATYQTSFSFGYAAQVMVGLPAIPSLVQQSRYTNDTGFQNRLTEPLDSPFEGLFQGQSRAVPVRGRLTLTPHPTLASKGRFVGTTQDLQPVDVEISGTVNLGKPVFGSPEKTVELRGLTGVRVEDQTVTSLIGSVKRPFMDWYQAPRDNLELDRLHGKLSHLFDIASVFTWIAGLLNVMAIWDAYDGPAYGYGDEKPEDEDEEDSSSKT